MDLKLPPVVVLFVFGILMYVVAKVLPFGHFDFFGRRYAIYFLLFLALSISFVAMGYFFRAKTTVDPLHPSKATKLVTQGIFAYSRNPMYLGMLLLLLALGLQLGNAFNVLLAAGFVGYMNRFQILPEEKALHGRFGKTYQQYCVKTRRWF